VSAVYKTIKVTEDVHKKLAQLISDVNHKGWLNFDVNRDDTPTMSSVVEECIQSFLAKKS